MTDELDAMQYDGDTLRVTVSEDAVGEHVHVQIGDHTLIISPLDDETDGAELYITDHAVVTISGEPHRNPVVSVTSDEYPTEVRIHDTEQSFY